MNLVSKILSLNIGAPEELEWRGDRIRTSMRKHPTPGPLVVHSDHIEGNSFANAVSHGNIHNVLYAYGMTSALDFIRGIGRDVYAPGSTGETLTVDSLDETEVSVGDIFEIGEVIAQATFPRTPCRKVDFCVQHERGRQAMIDCGRSGVYFRILRPGKIHSSDLLRRTERSQHPFPIFRLYQLLMSGTRPTAEELDMAKMNPAFLESQLKRWA